MQGTEIPRQCTNRVPIISDGFEIPSRDYHSLDTNQPANVMVCGGVIDTHIMSVTDGMRQHVHTVTSGRCRQCRTMYGPVSR